MTIFTTFLTTLIATLLSVSSGVALNFYLQKKLMQINNQQNTIDFLLKYVGELRDLYLDYWQKEGGDTSDIQLHVKIKQTQISDFLHFSKRKYKMQNTGNRELITLIREATGEDFESNSRQPNPSKCVKISKYADVLTTALLENKL